MNTAVSRRAHDAATPFHAGATAFDLMADSGREQLAMALEVSAAMFRGLDALRGVQQRAAQAGSIRHRAAARQVRSATDPVQLATMPATLWEGDLASAVHAWQEFAAAMLDVQVEALQSVFSHTVDAESALEAASAIEALDVTARISPPARKSRSSSTRR